MKKLICGFILAVIVFTLTGCGMFVERPEVKEGEFNFSVTYEYAGEIKTVSGVYVCEYADLSWSLEGGYHRDWSGYIKGGGVEDHTEIGIINDGDEIVLVLDLRPDYFMGDYDAEINGIPVPHIMIRSCSEEGMSIIHDADEVEEICGAKIISYKYDSPIENTFGLFNFG